MLTMKKVIPILVFLSISFLPVIVAPAPTAQTLSATSVTQTSAVLKGKVNPNGLSTKIDFCSCDLSTSPTYFSMTPLQNIGSGNSDVTVSYTLTGLTPGTTYSYCVRSTNSAGSQNGSCVTFTTLSGSTSSTTLRIDSNVSNFQVWWDGAYNHTTPYNYALLNNVPSGTHTVTLRKSGCTDASATITIIPGMTNTVTINMSCDSGGGGTESPDIDGDGVPDDEDTCYNPDCNVVDSSGCPKDSDRDGINECRDSCPYEEGSSANDGCPLSSGDQDNDGVTDDQDACYNPECDIVDSQGCPKDSDDDGLDDCRDECPSEYGERKNDGCPAEDSDRDGVTNGQDQCYNPGCNLVDSQGCPWDSDGDGLNDCEDNCPNQSGSRSNNGCPEEDSGNNGVSLVFYMILAIVAIAIVGIGVMMQRKKAGQRTEVKKKKPEAPQKLTCPLCKNKIEEDWNSCPHCGTRLKDDTRIYE